MTFRGGITTSHIVRRDSTTATADEVLNAAPGGGEEAAAMAEATAFLRAGLGDAAMPVKVVKAEAKDLGITGITPAGERPGGDRAGRGSHHR